MELARRVPDCLPDDARGTSGFSGAGARWCPGDRRHTQPVEQPATSRMAGLYCRSAKPADRHSHPASSYADCDRDGLIRTEPDPPVVRPDRNSGAALSGDRSRGVVLMQFLRARHAAAADDRTMAMPADQECPAPIDLGDRGCALTAAYSGMIIASRPEPRFARKW